MFEKLLSLKKKSSFKLKALQKGSITYNLQNANKSETQRLFEELSIAFGFLPQILGGGRSLWMVLCHSWNTDWVVGILRSGGNIQTLTGTIQFVLTFLHSNAVGMLKHQLAPKPPGEIFST